MLVSLSLFLFILFFLTSHAQKDILFIICDDMRPDLSVYNKVWAITPHFDRLAKKSVVFDLAMSQVAVCNPSRDSLLTGLRPDTVGSLNFQSSFRPHSPLPSQLKQAGYETIGVSKVFQWDGPDDSIWSHYDAVDTATMKAFYAHSTLQPVPSSISPESSHRDYQSTTIAIQTLRKHQAQSKGNAITDSGGKKPLFLALGLTAAHPPYLVPEKYYRLHDNSTWPRLTSEETSYPQRAPIQSYRNSGENTLRLVPVGRAAAIANSMGTPRKMSHSLNNNKLSISPQAADEIMWGHAAAVSFIDAQLGRILDVVDELDLWSTMTIVVTSDHGCHLGEKGIWEKWTLFDESTRVPLIIHHPNSPFAGQHYTKPVELIDVMPTLLSINGVGYVKSSTTSSGLSGKSLAPILLGPNAESNIAARAGAALLSLASSSSSSIMPELRHNFAVSQTLLCSSSLWQEVFDESGYPLYKDGLDVGQPSEAALSRASRDITSRFWTSCDLSAKSVAVYLMGYSIRTSEFRYTAYVRVDKNTLAPDFSAAELSPWAEELYDHRNEVPGASSHGINVEYHSSELVNLADEREFQSILNYYRRTLHRFLRSSVTYSRLPLQKHAKEYLDHQRAAKLRGGQHMQMLASPTTNNPKKGGSATSLFSSLLSASGSFGSGSFPGSTITFDSAATIAVASKSEATSSSAAPVQLSPQRMWQTQQYSAANLLNTRRSSNALFGASNNDGTNVLMIMYDDLRPELSIYGRSHMLTPNFERLAARSVIFDYAFTHISVCNPSRNCMMTGLRPDTKRSYAFDSGPDPQLTIPQAFRHIGYETSQAGKLFHWDGPNSNYWDNAWDWDWYGYQGREWDWMRSHVMPDKTKAETDFPDYFIATETIKSLRKYHKSDQKFFIGAGFKMPHTALHIPYRYYEIYKNMNLSRPEIWRLSEEERSYPISATTPSYRCCTAEIFKFMNNEGELQFKDFETLEDIDHQMSQAMYTEMMIGYSAAVTYVDTQLGRILDVLDELDMWKNLTIILTADHGMHNGEKGIWEKWTLFDESTRIPLLIHHPQSPFAGQHYPKPVEHVDVFPTMLDLVGAPMHRVSRYVYKPGTPKIPLSGKSLAPIVLGTGVGGRRTGNNVISRASGSSTALTMPILNRTVALSQLLRCMERSDLETVTTTPIDGQQRRPRYVIPRRNKMFTDCNLRKTNPTKVLPLMGYSLRTSRFRYTAWMEMNTTNWEPIWDHLMTDGPLLEELFDHRNEKLTDFTHMETVNIADSAAYRDTTNRLRAQLISYLRNEMVYAPLK